MWLAGGTGRTLLTLTEKTGRAQNKQAWRENCDFWSVLLGCGTHWRKVPGGPKCCWVVRCALSSPAPRICSETSGLPPSALSSLDKPALSFLLTVGDRSWWRSQTLWHASWEGVLVLVGLGAWGTGTSGSGFLHCFTLLHSSVVLASSSQGSRND